MKSRTPLCSNLETDIDVTSYDFFFLTFVSIQWLPLLLLHISLGPATVITTSPLYPARTSVAFGLYSAVSGFKSASTKSLVNKLPPRTPRPPPSSLLFSEYGIIPVITVLTKNVYRGLTDQFPCRI